MNNILFKSPLLRASSTEQLYKAVGKPQRLPVQRLDQQSIGPEAPQYCVPSATIVQVAEEVRNVEVVIADFGEAFVCDSGRRKDVSLRTPILLLPPESIFGEGVDQSADIWTVACTLYEILGERPLFEGFMADEDHVVAEMISTLGSLPKRWWLNWTARNDYFLNVGSWKQDTTRRHAPYSRPLSERLRIMSRGEGAAGDEFSSSELAMLERLLRSMLTYEPAQRVKSDTLQSEAWMMQYGLPALH